MSIKTWKNVDLQNGYSNDQALFNALTQNYNRLQGMTGYDPTSTLGWNPFTAGDAFLTKQFFTPQTPQQQQAANMAKNGPWSTDFSGGNTWNLGINSGNPQQPAWTPNPASYYAPGANTVAPDTITKQYGLPGSGGAGSYTEKNPQAGKVTYNNPLEQQIYQLSGGRYTWDTAPTKLKQLVVATQQQQQYIENKDNGPLGWMTNPYIMIPTMLTAGIAAGVTAPAAAAETAGANAVAAAPMTAATAQTMGASQFLGSAAAGGFGAGGAAGAAATLPSVAHAGNAMLPYTPGGSYVAPNVGLTQVGAQTGGATQFLATPAAGGSLGGSSGLLNKAAKKLAKKAVQDQLTGKQQQPTPTDYPAGAATAPKDYSLTGLNMAVNPTPNPAPLKTMSGQDVYSRNGLLNQGAYSQFTGG